MPLTETVMAGVVGSGTMGAGIAISFANAGIDVRLMDSSAEALERGGAAIAAAYASQVERGRLTAAEAEARKARVTPVRSYEELSGVDVAIEAVFEDIAIKREVFAALGAVCRRDALLATNTSTLDIDAIAEAAPNPARTVGLHFFSPAHVMKLLEIVRGRATAPETIEEAVALGKRLGKIPVVVGNCDGFVGNRMLLGYKREAEFLVLAGATPKRVDDVLEAFGFAMGPFAVSDLAGIDVGWRAKQERLKRGAAPPFTVTNLPDLLVAAGRLGQKSGKGYFRYEPGDRTRYPDPEVDALIAAERARLGVALREIGDDEIVARSVYALVNEGSRILDDGIAEWADDIDTIWVNGYGFPRERGGPMRYAEDVGLATVLAAVRAFAAGDPTFWKPAAALERAAGSGRYPRRGVTVS